MDQLAHSYNSHRFKLIVFDLDLTLWKFRLDKHMKSPFRVEQEKVVDSYGREPKLMDDTIPCLDYLKQNGYLLGIASRIDDIAGAYQLINLLGLVKYFSYREIYPRCKTNHFDSLRHKSNVAFEDMLFFDDDLRNICKVSKLGVSTIHVPQGISQEIMRKSI